MHATSIAGDAASITLPTRPFGRGGPMVGVLGFGSAEIGFLETGQATVDSLVASLVDRGVNLLDTAAMYRGSEEALGTALRNRSIGRDRVVVVSKCGSPPGREGLDPWCAESIRLSIERSLKRLRIDCLDAILLHSCDLATLEKGEAIGAIVEARKAGLVKRAGYSGDNEAAVFAAKHPEIEVLETSLSIADMANLDEVLPAAEARGLAVIVKRPVANAAWRRNEDQEGMYSKYAAPYHERLSKMGLDPASLGIEGPAEQAWPELALRFVLSFTGVTSALVGSSKPHRVAENAAIAAKGPLPAEAIEAIRAAFAKARGGESWPGLT
jgi:aryl-alcohol dehydrogenase-like predicted oxidoreductase